MGVFKRVFQGSDDTDHARTLPPEDDTDVRTYETGGPPWAEPVVAGTAVLAALLLAAFGVLVLVDPDTQLMGGTLGGGLFVLAICLVLASATVFPREKAIEPREVLDDPEAEEETGDLLKHGLDGVNRRRLLTGAGATAGAGLTVAAAAPFLSLGPSPSGLGKSPWRAGTAIVDPEGKPVTADDLEIGSYVTGLPVGADPREQGSGIIIVRLDPATLPTHKGREGWTPEGIVAYSKACTHAGCAVSLFRHPVYEPTSRKPALVCPCHYSTFDVANAGNVIYGPAGRPLPQLPVRIRPDRRLVAGGRMSGPIGPGWWGTGK